MTPNELRRVVSSSVEDVSEASFRMVQGLNHLMRSVMNENKELHDMLCREQAANARLNLELMNLNIEVERLDETICELITPLRGRNL